MAIQNRRGQYADFDPSKAVPGELLTVLSGDPNAKDGKAVYMTFASGDVKRMATYEDMVDNIEAATEDVAQDVAEQIEENLQPLVTTAQTAAQTATTKANEASQSASSVSASAAQIETNKNDISDLKSAISLHDDEIDNTVQTITFASDGSVQKIEHKRDNVIIRTDTFTFTANTITEVRTLNTGESLAIVTNLQTLETVVTYATA